MKLTWRLSIAVSASVLAILVTHAAVRVQHDVARFRDGVRADHRTLGLAIAAALVRSTLEEGSDPSVVVRLIDDIDRNEPTMSLRWVRVDEPVVGTMEPTTPVNSARRAGEMDTTTIRQASGPDAIVTHVLVALRGRPLTAVEIVEPLTRQADYEREALTRSASTTAVVVALCVTLILAFGVFFVGRPLERLRRHAESIGRGERGARTAIGSRDEIGELAREMNSMAAALDAARERAHREEGRRIETLAQLRHADRLRAVGELASALAHDLGAPLNAVNARAHLIASGAVDAARARELSGRIVDEVERISHSIRLLLDHGRRETPRRERVDLAALAASVAELVEPIAYKRGVEIRVEAPEHPLQVEGDPGQIRHVILNLVTNALDAAPTASRVTLRIERDDTRVALRVEDHGSGVAPENLARIFEPFFTTKDEGEGTGLGLSIARAIVLDHGGQLVASPARSVGTELIMTLPIAA